MADAQPFGMTGMPGSNFGGTNVGAPLPAPGGTPSTPMGTTPSPFLPTPPTGQQVPGMTSTMNTDPTSLLAGINPSQLWGLGAGDPNAAHNFVKAMRKAGFSSGVAGQLWNFINTGAGFNPAVAQALIAALGPGIERGEANIEEQFSAKGLREGSPAAIALGDFFGQVNLNEGQIFAQLYEQSVQNYMNVLLAGKGPAPASTVKNILDVTQAIKNLADAASAGATANSGGQKSP